MLELGFDNVSSGLRGAVVYSVHSPELWHEIQTLPARNCRDQNLHDFEIDCSPEVSSYQTEHDQLVELATTNMTAEESAQFISDMNAFEERARQSGLSEDEVRETYSQIIRLFDEPQEEMTGEEQSANAPLLMTWQRVDIAQQVMNQAAYPTSIDQGPHPTCTVASIEARMYTLDPSAAAQMVADVALTGQYTFDQDGQTYTVHVDPAAHGESSDWSYTSGNSRSYASEIFETAALNVYYALHPLRDSETEYIYVEDDSQGDAVDRDRDGFVVETIVGGNETYRDFTGLQSNALTGIYNAIADEPDSEIIVSWGAAEVNINGDSTGIAADTEDVMFVGSYDEFQSLVATLAADGALPVIARVWTNGPPFGFEVTAHSSHVLSVTGYTPGPPPMVEVDNQWGDSQDFFGSDALPLQDFYLAMLTPGSLEAIAILEERVEAGRASGIVDVASEMDLLRQLKASQMSDEDFAVRLIDTMQVVSDYLASGNSPDEANEKYTFRRSVGILINDIDDQSAKLLAYNEAYRLDLVSSFDSRGGLEDLMIAAAHELIQNGSLSDDVSGDTDTDTDTPNREQEALLEALQSRPIKPHELDENLEQSLVDVYNSLSVEDQSAFLQEAYDEHLDLSLIPGIVPPEGWVPVEHTGSVKDVIDVDGIDTKDREAMRHEFNKVRQISSDPND